MNTDCFNTPKSFIRVHLCSSVVISFILLIDGRMNQVFWIIWINDYFTKMTGLIILCPITKTDNGFPLHLKLSGYNTYGYVMIEHVKSMDYNQRDVDYIETLRQDDLIEVLSVLNACF